MWEDVDFWLLVAAIGGGGVSLIAGLILHGRYKRREDSNDE